MLTNKALAAIALTSALMGASTTVRAIEIADLAQLPKGDPVRKLVILHWQEVQLERITKGLCYVDAGIERDKNEQIIRTAGAAFEKTLPDIEYEIKQLDSKSPIVKSLQRNIEKKRKKWFQLRTIYERELKAARPSKEALGDVALLEQNLLKTIEKTFKVVRRKATKEGKATLADSLQESSTFNRVFTAERLVKQACFVSIGAGADVARMKLADAVVSFDKLLDSDLSSPITPAEIKELVPEWKAILPRVMQVAQGGAPDDDLLRELDRLKSLWGQASGEPELGTASG